MRSHKLISSQSLLQIDLNLNLNVFYLLIVPSDCVRNGQSDRIGIVILYSHEPQPVVQLCMLHCAVLTAFPYF